MAYKLSDDEVKTKLTRLAGYARTASGPMQAPTFGRTQEFGAQIMPKENTWQSQNFIQKIGAVATQTAGMGLGLAKGITNFGIESAKTTYQDFNSFLKPVAQTLTGSLNREVSLTQEQSSAIDRQMQDVVDLYKAGKVSKDWYSSRLRDLSKDYQDLSSQAKGIATQADRGNVIEGAAKTLTDIMAFGTYTSGAKVISATAKTADAQKLYKGMGFSANLLKEGTMTGNALAKLESLSAKVPSVKALLEAKGAKFASTGNIYKQSMKDAATALLLKQPLVYHSSIDDMAGAIDAMASGKYGDALAKTFWTAQLALSGGIFGLGFKAAGKGGDLLKLGAVGKSSYFDEIAKRTMNGNPKVWVDWLNKLKETNPEQFKRVEKVMRQAQEYNLRVWKTGEAAADQVAAHYASNHGIDLSSISFSKFMSRELKYWENLELLDDAAKAGKLRGISGESIEAGKVALGIFDQASRQALYNDLMKLSYDDRLRYLQSMRDEGATFWAQHDNMYNKIYGIVQDTKDADKLRSKIKQIDAGTGLRDLPKDLADRLAKDGYIAIVPKNNLTKAIPVEDTRKLITGAIKGDKEVFDESVAALPGLKGLYGILTKYGLSPEANNRVAYQKLSSSVVGEIDELHMNMPTLAKAIGKEEKDVTVAGKVILDKLKKYADSMPGFRGMGERSAVADLRQLTYTDVSKALGISRSEAKALSQAIANGYMKVPMEFRGMGDRAVDAAYRFIPGFKSYSRVQSALRYTYNPFFRVQEEAETRILSKLQGRALMWRKSKKELDEVAKKLEDARIFSTGFSGEGAQDVILGRLTANITQGQKRNLAGLAAKIADSKGTTVDDLIKNNFDEIEDALRVVVQYPSKGVISSPLARTLNLAFFPMRYNMKVTGLVAKELSKMPPTTQYAFVNGLFDMKDWMKSDEGIQWQSQNADAIALFKWLTPIGSVDYVMQLLGHKPESVQSLGQLGGLPFGWIPQMLDSLGAFDLNTPYVDPKTGKVAIKKVPTELKSQAAVALLDLLNSTFTYPGRVLGLPGKNATLKSAVDKFINTSGKDFESRIETDRLTPLQKKTVEVLKGNTSDEALDDLYLSEEGRYQLPTWDLPFKEFESTKRQLTADEMPKSKGKKSKAKKTALPLAPIR